VPRLKCTFREFIEVLEANGFKFDRQKGSHRQYERVVGKMTHVVTVAGSGNEEIDTGTLKSMIRQSGLPQGRFRK
jgi:predicted RNA binding protein YcfA (HicA-like mRNA interferase family)